MTLRAGFIGAGRHNQRSPTTGQRKGPRVTNVNKAIFIATPHRGFPFDKERPSQTLLGCYPVTLLPCYFATLIST